MMEKYMGYIELMGMSPYTYFTRYVLPMLVLLLIFPPAMFFLISPIFGTVYILYLFILVSLLIFAVLLIFPFLAAENVRGEIENNIHLYVTHLAALSTCDVPVNELFRAISLKKEYGALAKAANEIYMRFTVWHVTLGDSCRITARGTPSKIFSDFLDRFASALDSGENLPEFLNEEQNVVMGEYTIRYRGALYDVEVLKDVFVSIVITLVFLISFVIIVPYITGMDVNFLTTLVMVLYVLLELGMVYYIKSVLPEDKIWNEKFTSDEMKKTLVPLFALSLGLSLFIALAVNAVEIPRELKIALSLTPFLIIGYVAREIEEKIKRRDTFFVEFIISFGLGVAARGGIVVESLRDLVAHDFGPLSVCIKNLFERLKTRINVQHSWLLFQKESGSYLMSRFVNIFVEGVDLGGKPNKISEIIGRNFMQLQMLRRERYNSTASTIGIMYGLQAGVSFSLYVAGGIVKYMDAIYSRISVPEQVLKSIIFRPPPTTIEIVYLALILAYVLHALFSAITIRLSDGGHMLNAMIHFVILVWVGTGIAILVQAVMEVLMPLPIPISA